MDKAIVIEGLKKTYSNGTEAVKGVSLTVDYGEVFGFLGPNGAGKSTTIKAAIGLLKPTSGKVYLDSFDIEKYPYEARISKGYASQETSVDDTLTAYENIYLQGKFFHLAPKEIDKRAKEALQMFGLWDRKNDLVESFSGGMRKRLDIASALIHEPKILFLDEPTLGLDIQTRHAIWDYIINLQKNLGITIFLTTHYLEEADKLCDRIAIIDQGEIKAMDKPGILKSNIGGDIITLTFETKKEKTNSFINLIGKMNNIKSANMLKNNVCRIVVEKNGDQIIPIIFSLAQQKDISIGSVRLKRPTLDDVYLNYTGKTIREAESTKEETKKERLMMRRMRKK